VTTRYPIKIEPLTDKAFRPFGQVIEVPERPPDFRGGGRAQLWSVAFEATGTTQVSVIRVPYGELTFHKLERHFAVTQTFIPLHGSPAVVALAPPTDPHDRDAIPQPEQVRAFLLDGTKGYVLARGTWHSLDRYPLYPPASVFVMLNDSTTAADLAAAYRGQGGWQWTQEVDYAARCGITFEIVL
jgi:ureidoglycolate lyase